MKTIEEKAKAYDEALKVLHKYDGANIMFSQSLKEEMFPELAESEDERIRRKLISYFSSVKGFSSLEYNYGITGEDAVAWLEKQGERYSSYIHITQNIIDYINKHKENFENDIPKLGDIWNVKKICTYPCVNNGKPVVEVENNKGAWMRLPLHIVYSVQGDSLILPNPSNNGKNEQKPTDKIESTAHNYITPNQQFFQWIYNRLMYVHNENPDVDYMLSLKERIEDMQKPAWSEEDDVMLRDILRCLPAKSRPEYNQRRADWLKSLKERIGRV